MGGSVKFKNLYALPEKERSERFHLVSLVVSVVHKSERTLGEMASSPEGKAILDRYCEDPPPGFPAERWERHTSLVRQMLVDDAAVRDAPVSVIGEVQILLDDVKRVRDDMQEPYKYHRAGSAVELYEDIVNSMSPGKKATIDDSLGGAALEGRVNLVKRMLEGGANVDDGDGDN